MTIEQLAQMEKYYFPDNELSANDFEFVLANLPQSAKQISFSLHRLTPKSLSYDIRDYYAVWASCDELKCNPHSVLFSARYRCIKYTTQNDERIMYIDFTKELFNPQGDTISHSITVGKFQFFFKCPIQYNILMILLKWSDLQYEDKKLPVIGRLDAQPLFISSEIQSKYSVDVDVKTSVPLAVGFGELTILDKYFVRPEAVLKGGLFFYLRRFRDLNNECAGIEELMQSSFWDAPTPQIGVFPSPCERRHDYLEAVYRFNRNRNFKILGNDEQQLLYIVDNEGDDYYLELRLLSKRDYYSVAAWLIVTLSCRNCRNDDKYLKIREFWPACPILTKGSGKYTIERASEKEKLAQYLPTLKLFYKPLVNALQQYSHMRTDEVDAQDIELSELFKAECIALIEWISLSDFVMCGMDLLNELMDASYDLDKFTTIKGRVYSEIGDRPSELLRTIFTNAIFEDVKEQLAETSSKAILSFYKVLGSAFIDIASISDKKDARAKLELWILYQQMYVGNFKDNERHPDTLIDNTIKSQASSKGDFRETISPGEHKRTDDNCLQDKTVYLTKLGELESLVGLESIKNDVINMISLVKMQQMRKNKGLKSVPVSLHLVFTGNPGTGKTTVARILAQLYKEIGVLKTGQLVEVDRADLVAGYVGQTALKTEEKINEALGGILFIDEAYTLAKDGNDFGQEAIDTILKAMEDKRDEFIVIVAGYSEPMENFINSNPGLKSRFNKYFHFQDYSPSELIEIFTKMLRTYDYSITDEALAEASKKITEMEQNKGSDFANARDVRNYFEQIITRQAVRVSAISAPSEAQILEITQADI